VFSQELGDSWSSFFLTPYSPFLTPVLVLRSAGGASVKRCPQRIVFPERV
jgi:hypothetical protein